MFIGSLSRGSCYSYFLKSILYLFADLLTYKDQFVTQCIT